MAKVVNPETEHLFDDKLISKMKRGAYLVNTARAKIVDRDAVVRALDSGQLAGYAGDVWFPQPAQQGRCHVKQFYCRNAVTRLCSTFVFSMPWPLRRV